VVFVRFLQSVGKEGRRKFEKFLRDVGELDDDDPAGCTDLFPG
jgi:hypothetical protein